MSVQTTLNAVGVAQVIVTLKNVPPGNGAALAAAGRDVQHVTRHFRRSEDSRPGAVAAATGRRKPPSPCKVYKNLGVILGTVDQKGYRGLKKDPSVKAVNEAPQISLIKPVAATLATAAKGPTWGIKRLKVEKLWAQGLTGTGVLVGHLDTGVDAKHPAFKGGAIAKFAEFDDLGEIVPGAKAHDSDEHGTHTAGTIVGRAVKGSVFGVAPGAQLASAMVIEGGDVIARILGGMDWIVGEGARILSMSLGLRGFHAEFLPLMQAIRNRGILPVIAVGNEGPGTSRSPGNYDLVLSVGASSDQDEVADFSSSQRFVAPGRSAGPGSRGTRRGHAVGATRRAIRRVQRLVDGDAPHRGPGGPAVAGKARRHRGGNRSRHPEVMQAAGVDACGACEPGRAGRRRCAGSAAGRQPGQKGRQEDGTEKEREKE